MGLFRRLSGLLGRSRNGGHHHHHDDNVADTSILSSSSSSSRAAAAEPAQHLLRRGFSVPVQLAGQRDLFAPLLVFCHAGDGGVQGLKWYARNLKIDEDGDVADEFLDEVSPDMSTTTSMKHHDRQFPRFQVKHNITPAKVKSQALLPNGKIQQYVEYQGRLQWA